MKRIILAVLAALLFLGIMGLAYAAEYQVIMPSGKMMWMPCTTLSGMDKASQHNPDIFIVNREQCCTVIC